MKQLGPEAQDIHQLQPKIPGVCRSLAAQKHRPFTTTDAIYVGAALTFLFRLASHVPSFISSVSSFFTFCVLPSIQIIFCP